LSEFAHVAEFGRRLGTLVKQRYMLSAMCGRSTYKVTWEEIVRLYRLTLEQSPVNTQARYNVRPTTTTVARRPPWVLTKDEGMSDDRTKADKAWEARQEAARYRIFNAATNAAEATDEADDENYFAVLDQAGNAAETAAAEITGYKTYADLLEALDTRRKQS
jgi:hypothetical protein